MFSEKLALPSFPSFSKVLTEEQDIDVFTQSRPKHVPLWVSPLEEHDKGEREKDRPDLRQASEGQSAGHGSQQGLLPTTNGSETAPPTAHAPHLRDRFESEEPVLRIAHESSVIQLFYDLFFVANLTTFTAIHEVTDSNSMLPTLSVPSPFLLHLLELFVYSDC